MMENTHDYIYFKDRHVLWANSAFEVMLDYDEDQVIGFPTRHFYVNEDE